MFLYRVIDLWENLGGKGSSSEKAKTFDRGSLSMPSESTCFSLNIILLSSTQRVFRTSYPFRRNFWRSGKWSFTERARNFNRGFISTFSEDGVFNFDYNQFLISVVVYYSDVMYPV